MDCKKVQDRFSSLWEKELMPSEERIVKEHLSTCAVCQKEFKQFEKTMHWLRSVGEVEVPDGFLTELQQKMEERKSKTISTEKARGRWLNLPLSLKLPAQAVAMVAIIFLVLYLTKMVPMEGYRLKEMREKSPPFSVDKKSEQVLAQKEVEKERRSTELISEAPRPKDVKQAKAPVLEEKKAEGTQVAQVKGEEEKVEIPSPKPEIMAYQQIESKEGVREIILKISNREKVISQLGELVKKFHGEIVTSEEKKLLASIPVGSFSDFEKELVRLSASAKADQVLAKKHVTGSLKAAPGGKREEADEKSGEPTRLIATEEGRIAVRILLVEE